jgi:SWI/SNF-related matrix-associated actin-dependent regulator of chromatin subfamily A3
LLDGWLKEISMHITPDSLNFLRYHGPKRETDVSRIAGFDVVLTTYGTLTAEFCRGTNLLHGINWFRVVLDEGRCF